MTKTEKKRMRRAYIRFRNANNQMGRQQARQAYKESLRIKKEF